MSTKALIVEYFFAAGCSKCAEARIALHEAAQARPDVAWVEVDIAKNPHRAVAVGVVTTPSVAIDGELLFKRLPSGAQLRAAIEARLGKA